jgi:hypothetical protein
LVPPWTLERADPAVVQAVLRERGLEQTLAKPGWPEYFTDLAEALVRRFADTVGSWLSLSPGSRAAVELAAKGLAVLVLVLALAWAVRAWLRRRRPLELQAPDGVVAPTRAPVEERGAEGWAHELTRRLAQGEAGPALEALWWWLATSITDGRVDPAWTSQELVERSRRPQLVPHVRILDRLIYGGRSPAVEDVRRLASRLREALA